MPGLFSYLLQVLLQSISYRSGSINVLKMPISAPVAVSDLLFVAVASSEDFIRIDCHVFTLERRCS